MLILSATSLFLEQTCNIKKNIGKKKRQEDKNEIGAMHFLDEIY